LKGGGKGKGSVFRPKKKHRGQYAGAGLGGPDHSRGARYVGCASKGTAVVLFSPFVNMLLLQVERTAHTNMDRHPPPWVLITDVPREPGALLQAAVRCLDEWGPRWLTEPPAGVVDLQVHGPFVFSCHG
jgi:hypothetical protein